MADGPIPKDSGVAGEGYMHCMAGKAGRSRALHIADASDLAGQSQVENRYCSTVVVERDYLGIDIFPSGRIQTWALEEARRRLEAEGILEDPDQKQ